MTLLGNRLLILPVKKDETASGLKLVGDSANIAQQYEITHVGDDVADDTFKVGKRIIITDQILNRVPKLNIEGEEHALITPDNVIGLP